MSWDLVLGFFPEEMQRLILDNAISDLMINGTTGVFADRNGMVEHIPLTAALTTDTLLAATQQIARKLGQNLSDQNPILNTRLPDGSRVAVVGPPAGSVANFVGGVLIG
jgi:pilus assembly protein CpaF